MSSDNALVSGQGSGVGWQVNIPSFGSLALNLGVAALKQLATAGVSEHTLQCMLMIAEVCPASNDYRKEISICRQEQRKNAVWIYKVVELGTATNFIADELLKSRAGENVIALMSALLPVMSEESSDAVILKLFDRRGASPNVTPGFSQLQALRTILAPLLRKTEFKDKAFQYHSLLKRLLVDKKSLPSMSLDVAYDSIPSEETMVHIIQLLSELIQEGDKKILAYHGLKGAAWCIAYARHVLGLAVCVFRTTVDLVPINGQYNNARVLVYIFAEGSRCDIILQGKVTDFFDIKGLEPHEYQGHYGWAIDASKTKVLDCYLPASGPWRTRAVEIVTSFVHTYTEYIARHIHGSCEDRKLENIGLVKYSVYCLPAVRRRASNILELLGFNSHPGYTAEASVWRQYVTILRSGLKRRGKDGEYRDIYPNVHKIHLVPGPAWLSSPQTLPKARRGTHRLEDPSEDAKPPSRHEVLEFDDDEIWHITFLLSIVVAVSWLAFTNWDENLHIISINFLERTNNWQSDEEASLIGMLLSYGQDVDHSYILDETNLRECAVRRKDHRGDRVGVVDLINKTANISFDGFRNRRPDFTTDSILAAHHRGFVVARNPAIQQSLDVEASYVFFILGSISANGERREVIYANQGGGFLRSHPAKEPLDYYQPSNMFPTLELSSHAQFSGNDLEIHQNILIDDRICEYSPLPLISKCLGEVYVANGCDHSYYRKFRPLQSGGQGDQSPRIRIVNQGLFAYAWSTQHLDGKDSPICYLEAVDQNGCGQWIACGSMAGRTRLTILQRNTCLQCTCEMAEQGFTIASGSLAHVCVIPGRMKDEPMD